MDGRGAARAGDDPGLETDPRPPLGCWAGRGAGVADRGTPYGSGPPPAGHAEQTCGCGGCRSGRLGPAGGCPESVGARSRRAVARSGGGEGAVAGRGGAMGAVAGRGGDSGGRCLGHLSGRGPRPRSSTAIGLTRSPGEVPERLNGRDWKSRNGGQPRSGVRIPPSPLAESPLGCSPLAESPLGCSPLAESPLGWLALSFHWLNRPLGGLSLSFRWLNLRSSASCTPNPPPTKGGVLGNSRIPRLYGHTSLPRGGLGGKLARHEPPTAASAPESGRHANSQQMLASRSDRWRAETTAGEPIRPRPGRRGARDCARRGGGHSPGHRAAIHKRTHEPNSKDD